MKKIMFILSLLLPLSSVDAADIQEALPPHQSSVIQRVKTFAYSAIGTTVGLKTLSIGGYLINKFVPSVMAKTFAKTTDSPWVLTAAVLIVGGISVYRSVCKPVDNRSAVAQVVDATIITIMTPAKAVISLVDTWREAAENGSRTHKDPAVRDGIARTLREAPAPVFHPGGASQWYRLPEENSTTPKKSRP